MDQGVTPGGFQFRCKCGHSMVIPAGQEWSEPRCPECLAIIRPADLGLAAAKPGAKPVKKEKKPVEKAAAKKAAGAVYTFISDAEGGIYQCVCGERIPVLKGSEAHPRRCPNCLEIVKPIDAINAELKGKVAPKKRGVWAETDWAKVRRKTLKWSVGMGVGCWLLGGLAGGVLVPMFSNLGWRGPATIWSFFGALLGIMIGTTWAITSGALMNVFQSIVVGCILGTVLAFIDWIIEAYLITMTDANALACFSVGIMGGIITGVIAYVVREGEEIEI